MGTTVSLNTTDLAADPGESVSTELRVRNTGDVVDQFAFQPLGDAAEWIRVEPPMVRLFPDTDEVVTVTITPPREYSTPPGVATWAVKAIPQEDREGAAVGEGTIDVGTFTEVAAELQPVTGRGRLTGRFEVAIDNRGNVKVPVRLTGTDQEQTLGFEFSPAAIETEPGSAHFTKLRIKPGTKIWRGQPKNHPFQVLVEPQLPSAPTVTSDDTDGGEAPPPPPSVPPVVLNGSLLQEPIIPPWFLKALLALIALIIALFILWRTLLKPRVESAARDVAIEEVAAVEEQVEELVPEVEEAAQQAEEAQEAAVEAEETAGQATETATAAVEAAGAGSNPVLNETSEPDFFRLTASAAPGSEAGAASAANAADTEWAITDIILQNPDGASGDVLIFVNGEEILRSALENFRDLDFHFVAPYVIAPEQVTEVLVRCDNPQPVGLATCDVAVSYSGFRTTITEE